MDKREWMIRDLTRTTARLELAEELMDLMNYHNAKEHTKAKTIQRVRQKLKNTINHQTQQQSELKKALGPKIEETA